MTLFYDLHILNEYQGAKPTIRPQSGQRGLKKRSKIPKISF